MTHGTDSVRVTHFDAPAATEWFVSVEAPPATDDLRALAALMDRYESAVRGLGLDADSEILLRFHLSDAAKQAPLVRKALTERDGRAFVAAIGQKPLPGGRMALAAYHLRADGLRKRGLPSGTLLVRHGAYTSIWKRNLPQHNGGSGPQTREVFNGLSAELAGHGACMADHLLRTWIYIRDIDRDYRDFAAARRELFAAAGLTRDTHFIASTAIGGLPEQPAHLICVDSFSVLGLRPEQVEHMSVLTHMCPTHQYDVTFERGVKIVYGDRAHYLISGTASIDRDGNIVHAGDLQRQAERALENISSLLAAHGGRLSDVRAFTVYLRNPQDALCAQAFLKSNLPAGVPCVLALGPVCRPAWLIEMEAVAVSSAGDRRFASFA